MSFWKQKGEYNIEALLLIRPQREYAGEIVAYRQEFLDAGDMMDGCGVLRRYEDPEEYIQVCLDRECPEKTPAELAPAIQLHLIRARDKVLLGMLQIRPMVNERIRSYSGNIGYSVRPSERRKGYAKQMLKMALPLCREMGMEKVLICCVADNIGSEKTILANGGVYESTVREPMANIDLKRFWITL